MVYSVYYLSPFPFPPQESPADSWKKEKQKQSEFATILNFSAINYSCQDELKMTWTLHRPSPFLMKYQLQRAVPVKIQILWQGELQQNQYCPEINQGIFEKDTRKRPGMVSPAFDNLSQTEHVNSRFCLTAESNLHASYEKLILDWYASLMNPHIATDSGSWQGPDDLSSEDTLRIY